ncbi:Keratin, type I cytoskeletal 18 [Plecturocebus cupreus]
MSFSTHSTFSNNYWSLGPIQVPSYGARLVSNMASVYAGDGGSGSRISVSRTTSLWGIMKSGGLATGIARGPAGMVQNEETMQCLNNCLTSYLDRVRSLEIKNRKLESKIREHLEKKVPQVRDWSCYFKTIDDLRAQIFANTVDNANIILQIDNACLAADDFRVKYETELAISQSVESDIHGLHKVIDDTNVTQLQLETEIEAVKKKLLSMKKNHKKK